MIPLTSCREVAVSTSTEIGLVVIIHSFAANQDNKLCDIKDDLPDLDFAFSIASSMYI